MDLRSEGLAGHPSGMLWALRFAGGAAEALTDPAGDDCHEDGGWTWTHFPLGDVRAQRFLAGLNIPAPARALIATDEDKVQIHAEGPWLYGVLPDVERDLGGKALEPARLFFACDGTRLITARWRAICAIDVVRHEAERSGLVLAPVAAVTGQVLHYLDLMEDKIEDLAETLDRIEDSVLGERAELDGRALGPLRRQLATYRRELAGLRGALHRTLSPRAGRRGELSVELADLPAPIDDVDREAASVQDRARLLHEEIDTLINSATNRSMRALTILSTLLIPPTLIVGAFGMNVGGIPWASEKGGFIEAGLLCLAVVVLAYWLLRRMRLL